MESHYFQLCVCVCGWWELLLRVVFSSFTFADVSRVCLNWLSIKPCANRRSVTRIIKIGQQKSTSPQPGQTHGNGEQQQLPELPGYECGTNPAGVLIIPRASGGAPFLATFTRSLLSRRQRASATPPHWSSPLAHQPQVSFVFACLQRR